MLFLVKNELPHHLMKKPSSETLRKVVVVAASCTIAFLIYSTSRLSGQLFLACRERFNVGRREAALPFLLTFICRNVSGPFVGYLGNKLGLLRVTMLGLAVSAVSVGACFFVEDIITFTVLWGGGFGTGFGMGSTLITNILHACFKTNFNKVQGLFLASACMGSFVLPGITEYLLKTYGTSGTFLILSGFVLHCIPAAMLLKEPEKSQHIQLEIKELKDTNQIYKEIKSIDCEITKTPTSQTNSNSLGAKNNEIVIFHCSPNDNTEHKVNEGDICYRRSYVTQCTKLSEKNILKNVEGITAITTEVNISKEQNKSIFVSDTKSQKEICDSGKPFYASDDKKKANSVAKLRCQCNSVSRNFQVFLDPAYILILISVGLSTLVVVTIYTVIADACRDKGIMEDVTVLMTLPITEMLGRLSFGFIADWGCISPLNIYALCCGTFGLLIIGFIWLDNFYVVLTVIAGFGALMGSVIVLPPGFIRDYIKEKNITMAFSSRYVLFAVLGLSQSSVIGYFRETLHSYDGLFYLLASMCVLSVIISLLIPSAARLRDRREMNNTKDAG